MKQTGLCSQGWWRTINEACYADDTTFMKKKIKHIWGNENRMKQMRMQIHVKETKVKIGGSVALQSLMFMENTDVIDSFQLLGIITLKKDPAARKYVTCWHLAMNQQKDWCNLKNKGQNCSEYGIFYDSLLTRKLDKKRFDTFDLWCWWRLWEYYRPQVNSSSNQAWNFTCSTKNQPESVLFWAYYSKTQHTDKTMICYEYAFEKPEGQISGGASPLWLPGVKTDIMAQGKGIMA